MNHSETTAPGAGNPWYREPWPWIIIGLLGGTVIACMITIWIAMSNPATLVVDDSEYQQIRGELRAQDTGESPTEAQGDADDGPG